jgi:putative lipoic acid-binding regulatory protein
MGDLPSIELLESTHQFPGPYVFKVIGRVENGFAARVVAAIRDVLDFPQDPPHSMRHASGGRHVSVTVVPVVQTPEQVLTVYRRVRQMAGLVMLM